MRLLWCKNATFENGAARKASIRNGERSALQLLLVHLFLPPSILVIRSRPLFRGFFFFKPTVRVVNADIACVSFELILEN